MTPLQEQQLRARARQKGYNEDTYVEFYKSKAAEVKAEPVQPVAKKGALDSVKTVGRVAKKVGNFIISSEKGVGESLSSGIVPTLPIYKQAQEADQQSGQKMAEVATKIREGKAQGKDVSQLEAYYKRETGQAPSFDTEVINPASTKSNKQALGEVAGVGLDVLTAGTYGAAAKGAKTGVLLEKAVPKVAEVVLPKASGGILKSTAKGALEGVKTGVPVGAAYGAVEALKQDGDFMDVVEGTVKGAAGGGLVGGVLGGVVSGAVESFGKLKSVTTSKGLREKIFKAQEEAGFKPSLSQTVLEKGKVNPQFKKIVNEGRKQGYSEREINFLATIADNDKPTLRNMFDLTVKAQSDPRQIVRAGDVLGDTVTKQVQQVQKLNAEAGKAVDATARALQGQFVDAAPVVERAKEVLARSGVTGIETGKLDFSNSIFKKTPAIQKQIETALSDLPAGKMDAYELHKFKKSIDEVVNYGTAGEGLKGTGANTLKSIRNAVDELLDGSFDDYNKANESYKLTREYIDSARDIAGKYVDFSKVEGAQAFGQALRSAFSNNKSRANTLKFIEDTHLLSKKLGLSGSEQNILDQALFVNLLEDTFGSEAATGLSGEVTKAINKVGAVTNAIRNPIQGALQGVAYVAEKARNITPEAKKKILLEFLK